MTTTTFKKNTKVTVKGHTKSGVIVKDIYGDKSWYGIRLQGEDLLVCATPKDITVVA